MSLKYETKKRFYTLLHFRHGLPTDGGRKRLQYHFYPEIKECR